MSERQIRQALQRFCDELDLRSKRSSRAGVGRKVLPLVVGAGLAVSACSDADPVPEYPAYGAPAYGVPFDAGSDADGGGGSGGEAGHGGQATGGAAGSGGGGGTGAAGSGG